MYQFSLENKILVEMVEGVEEISSQMEEDSHLLGAIMATIILNAILAFSNGQLTTQLNQKKYVTNNVLLAQIMVVK